MGKFSVIGGDQRSIMLAKLLIEDGNDVRIFGFDRIIEELDLEDSRSLIDAIKDTDIIIGPLPFSDEKNNLNTPFYYGEITIDEIFNETTKDQIIIGGKVDKEIFYLAQEKNINIIDYFEREEMQVLNAIPTAEGAVQLAMEEMPITLYDSNTIVLGFGRIGKVLAKTLYGLGANIYVAARKYSDIAWIKSYGYRPILFKELKDHIQKMDVVFNTIPKIVLKEDILSKINKKSLIIDLASRPGGVDFEKAKEIGIKTIWALGLPGKVAPITAAKVIKDTIYNIIEELGE